MFDDDLPATLLHGTPRPAALLERGLCVATLDKTGDDFDWLDRVVESYNEMTARERQPVLRYAGRSRITRRWLERNIALAWFTELESLAKTFGTVLVADMARIPHLWWFRDDLLPLSYVLVLERSCPQSEPNAFKRLG